MFTFLPACHRPPLRLLLLAAVAIVAFHLAYLHPSLAFLMLPFLLALTLLARSTTPRAAFYSTLAIGIACYAPHLFFFYGLFKWLGLLLWIVLAIPLAVFALLDNLCKHFLPRTLALVAIPFLFTGLEYARCECYFLRFAWLTPGLSFGNSKMTPILGVYGIGFVLAALAASLLLLPRKILLLAFVAIVFLLAFLSTPPATVSPNAPGHVFTITGIQCEMASQRELVSALDQALADHPATDLFILPEYALASPPTDAIQHWCALHQRYLLLGGTAPAASDNFYNTAFVIDPSGAIIFSQAKSVPIQFFRDGLPAPTQKLWHSPWGNIGILICYDLSYTRITDALVRQGAQILIVPTMDAASWGEPEHNLHARIAPARAAEYHIPIVRIASSGISQVTSSTGEVLASAPFPGPNAQIFASLEPGHPGRLPIDRYLAPSCVAATSLLIVTFLIQHLRGRRQRKGPVPPQAPLSTIT